MRKHILLEDANILVHADVIEMAQPLENPTSKFKSEVRIPLHGWVRCEKDFKELVYDISHVE